MYRFNQFIAEEVAENTRLSHLEHAEDHILNAGEKGARHSIRHMIGVHHALLQHNTPVKLTTKYDGAPAVVFGTHPETKKFFVGSKSVFNKTPKINYSHEDIDKNHGHAPGLADKLKSALDHLPKVTPKGKVYQGDLMHTPDIKKQKGDHIHFKPNTINYKVHKDHPEGEKAAQSKLGIAVHTEYTGKTHKDLKANFGPDTSKFKEHSDVHVMSTHTDSATVNYKPEHRVKFFGHINKAKKAMEGHDYSHLDHPEHQAHLKTYINQTVRDQSKPSVAGLKKHVLMKHEAMKSKVKTDATKQKIDTKAQGHLDHINQHSAAIKNTLKIHKHLQDAKHTLVKSLETSDHYKHDIEGRKTGPEGHVAFLGGHATKLVDRGAGGFASSNLLAGGIQKAKKTK